jgi:D-alanyl-D-alanine carboxypeptidase
MEEKAAKLQEILDKAVDNKKVFGTSFCVKYKNERWLGASGNLNPDSQFFIASTSKLYVTAIILHLKSKGLLDLESKISDFLEDDILDGLIVINGTDYSKELTIRHLLSHTSGLPDYFQQKDHLGNSLEKDILNGNDQYFSFEKIIEHTKKLKPLFIPGTKGKAYYSDSNFQLLGRIIEVITKKSISENFKELLFDPIGMSKTYLYSDIADNRPANLYFKDKHLFVPRIMTSFTSDGGLVSTAAEMMMFLEAFFNGKYFPKSYFEDLKTWNRIFFPMQSGTGIHKFKLLWIFNPLGSIPELIGHSGLSGALAFHSPEKDLYVTGTVNQIAFPDTSFRLMIKLIQKTLRS